MIASTQANECAASFRFDIFPSHTHNAREAVLVLTRCAGQHNLRPEKKANIWC
jgi:hypothetical protein